MLISVVVPVYNAEAYLRLCVDSLLAQTYRDIEIILVDDGSPDGCPGICDEYARADKRVRVIHRPNAGVVCARKAGLSIAAGDMIAFADADDWLLPDAISRLASAADEETDMVVGGCLLFQRGAIMERLPGFPPGAYHAQSLKADIYPHMICEGGRLFRLPPEMWAKLFNRCLIESVMDSIPNDLSLGEDALAVYGCALSSSKIVITDACDYVYRQRAASVTRGYDGRLSRSFASLARQMTRLAADHGGRYGLEGQIEGYGQFIAHLFARNELLRAPDAMTERKKRVAANARVFESLRGASLRNAPINSIERYGLKLALNGRCALYVLVMGCYERLKSVLRGSGLLVRAVYHFRSAKAARIRGEDT